VHCFFIALVIILVHAFTSGFHLNRQVFHAHHGFSWVFPKISPGKHVGIAELGYMVDWKPSSCPANSVKAANSM